MSDQHERTGAARFAAQSLLGLAVAPLGGLMFAVILALVTSRRSELIAQRIGEDR